MDAYDPIGEKLIVVMRQTLDHLEYIPLSYFNKFIRSLPGIEPNIHRSEHSSYSPDHFLLSQLPQSILVSLHILLGYFILLNIFHCLLIQKNTDNV